MPFQGPRPLDSAGDLRALSHPLRLRLLDLLQFDGPLTATEAAARLDTTPSNASFHLRVLARHGFVEDTGDGHGRNRPWRLVGRVLSVESDELDGDARATLRLVLETMLDRHRRNVLAWAGHRERCGREWREAAGETYLVEHLTAEELAELTTALRDALRPFTGRERRQGSIPVAITLSTLPVVDPESTHRTLPGAPSRTTTSAEEEQQ